MAPRNRAFLGPPNQWTAEQCKRANAFCENSVKHTQKQRVIKAAWRGRGPNKHIGQEACEQEELRGFTEKQVYDKRSNMNTAACTSV
jgi:hypothetical protein